MPQPEFSSRDILEGKIFALLGYLSILCIIPLLLKKENPFVLAHSKQGLVLFVAQVSIFVASIVIPGWLTRFVLFILGILSLWGMFSVLCGKDTRLPVICELADKISL